MYCTNGLACSCAAVVPQVVFSTLHFAESERAPVHFLVLKEVTHNTGLFLCWSLVRRWKPCLRQQKVNFVTACVVAGLRLFSLFNEAAQSELLTGASLDMMFTTSVYRTSKYVLCHLCADCRAAELQNLAAVGWVMHKGKNRNFDFQVIYSIFIANHSSFFFRELATPLFGK